MRLNNSTYAVSVFSAIDGGESEREFRGPGFKFPAVGRPARIQGQKKAADFLQNDVIHAATPDQGRAGNGLGNRDRAQPFASEFRRHGFLDHACVEVAPQDLPDHGLMMIKMVDRIQIRHGQAHVGQTICLQPVSRPGLGGREGHFSAFQLGDTGQIGSRPGHQDRMEFRAPLFIQRGGDG